jgi:hypothetical protein
MTIAKNTVPIPPALLTVPISIVQGKTAAAPDSPATTTLQQFVDALFAQFDAALAGHPFLLRISGQFKAIMDAYIASIDPTLAGLIPIIDGWFSFLEVWANWNPALKTWLTTIQAWVDSFLTANGGRPIIVSKV